MDKLLKMVEEIEIDIFNNNINTVAERISQLIEEINLKANILDEEEIKVLNEVLNLIIISIENKDYLLLADLLRYELLHLLLNSEGNRRLN